MTRLNFSAEDNSISLKKLVITFLERIIAIENKQFTDKAEAKNVLYEILGVQRTRHNGQRFFR